MHALTVSDESLLSVGQFAKLAGLSVHTLRHYDAVGLLPPADVDDRTGYRRYSRDQLTTVRVITDLRWLAVPIQQVREIIADEGSTRARELLRAHADRLMRERVHLDKQIAQCTQYADEGVPMPTITSATTPVQMKIGVTDVGRAREFYASAFGLAESVIRHTDEFDVTGFQFGTYGQPGFFLMLLVDSEAFDQPGRVRVLGRRPRRDSPARTRRRSRRSGRDQRPAGNATQQRRDRSGRQLDLAVPGLGKPCRPGALVQADRRGRRHVEALGVAGHRDPNPL